MSTYARRGPTVRLIFLFIAFLDFVGACFGRFCRNKVIVLCYHGINSDQQQRFREQMRRISLRIISLKEACSVRQHPANTLNVAITFDDAFENLLANAIPFLEEYQIPAIIFAVPGNLGQKPNWKIAAEHPEANEQTMTAEQLIALSNHPLITIGSHTHTHPDLTQLPPEKIEYELAESKRGLEQLLSQPVEDLALPHGAFNDTVLQIARQVGYKRIFTLEPKLMSSGGMQKGVIGRFSMSPDVWPIEFKLTCAGAYAWLLPWRNWIRRLRGFVKPENRVRKSCFH